MQIQEVRTAAHGREFREFAVRHYQADARYIRPLDQDIEGVFDLNKNKTFRHGRLCRWLLLDAGGQTLGRVAAFVNERTARTSGQPTGGLGFFECINEQAAANLLFDTARDWLREQGMEAMDGPINFGDRDQWWGLLLENFDRPLYGQNYNPPYYQHLFEAYGFELYFNQYTYFRKVADALPPAYHTRAAVLLNDPNYRLEHLRLSNLAKYAEDFRQVYNKAWVKHDGVKEMTPEQSANIMRKLRPVLDEKVCWFGYFQDEPVGFFIALPELNELFRHVNGNLNWWGKATFAWHRWRGAVRTLTGIAFGIVPAHQRKGLETAFVLKATNMIQDKSQVQYEDFVMNWIGDFNPKMMRVAESLGGRIWRTHGTFRYLFDREKPFERAKII